MWRFLTIVALALVCTTAYAQQSASFKLEESVLNAGGHPEGGTILASAGFRMTLDALGEGVVAVSLSGPSFRMDAGFMSGYMPPGEVHGLKFVDAQTLAWNPERSVGVYNLYRDELTTLGTSFGTCEQPGLSHPTATDTDPVIPGQTFFYLVTVENRLSEEGTNGFRGDGSERPNDDACP